jgi:hypothetical protein
MVEAVREIVGSAFVEAVDRHTGDHDGIQGIPERQRHIVRIRQVAEVRHAMPGHGTGGIDVRPCQVQRIDQRDGRTARPEEDDIDLRFLGERRWRPATGLSVHLMMPPRATGAGGRRCAR